MLRRLGITIYEWKKKKNRGLGPKKGGGEP